MVEKVKSAGGVVYYLDEKNDTWRFLLVKRQALSKRIERVAPKGKIQKGELPEQAAMREIQEEVGLQTKDLQVKQVLDTLSLQLYNEQGKLGVDKDITYFLIQYGGDPQAVDVADSEGFLGMYKRASIEEILGMVHYRDLRELFRKAYSLMGKINTRDDFIKSL